MSFYSTNFKIGYSLNLISHSSFHFPSFLKRRICKTIQCKSALLKSNYPSIVNTNLFFFIIVTKSLLKPDTSPKWDTKVLLPHLHLLPNQKGFNKGHKAKEEDQPNLKEQAKPFPTDFKELKNQTYSFDNLIYWN